MRGASDRWWHPSHHGTTEEAERACEIVGVTIPLEAVRTDPVEPLAGKGGCGTQPSSWNAPFCAEDSG